MASRAFITGVSGLELTTAEREFLRGELPWGLIMFKRNVETPDQASALVAEFRDIVGHPEAPVLIDQEGGRVARMQPPEWPAFPRAEAFAALYGLAPSSAIEATRVNARAIALTLRGVGINVNCLPLLDVRQPGASDIIGDRALGAEPMQVAALGRAVLDGMASAGVVGVVKHMPGHGRALVDSHKELPTVTASLDELRNHDFPPFKALADLGMAMTAHVVYAAIDPDRPATLSPRVIGEIIRGEIGFDGLLMTDDLSMKALSGDFSARAATALAAGCDVVLHCNGLMEEMRAVAAGVKPLAGKALERAERALAPLANADGADEAALRDEFWSHFDAVA